ncbi:TSUP family transporter [Nocardioides sp. SYSU DS0651]|uniref:TSUP family transporter n=1 Tax=Nocardioides sp. SYSU DS0651 TaxID=3415955 RepID=UPI003F4B67C6
MSILIAVAAGALIGLSLGALGGGGSILAVPVLVYLLDQSATQATTGSLVVVGVTSLIGAVAAHRAGNVLLGRGAVFGLVGIAGAAVGARAATHVDDQVLLAAFAALMLLVGGLMTWRQLRHIRNSRRGAIVGTRPALDDPILTFSPTFACDCPRALKVLLTATAVGLLTGFLGVGGGFLVVPALLVALALPMSYAAGTSLVVITITSAAALAVRTGAGTSPDWPVVLALTVPSALAAIAGARLAGRLDTAWLQGAFTLLVLGVATYTATQALPALL